MCGLRELPCSEVPRGRRQIDRRRVLLGAPWFSVQGAHGGPAGSDQCRAAWIRPGMGAGTGPLLPRVGELNAYSGAVCRPVRYCGRVFLSFSRRHAAGSISDFSVRTVDLSLPGPWGSRPGDQCRPRRALRPGVLTCRSATLSSSTVSPMAGRRIVGTARNGARPDRSPAGSPVTSAVYSSLRSVRCESPRMQSPPAVHCS